MDDNDYSDMLDMKLEEELQEYLTAETADQVGELADLVEVVYAILDNQGISIEEFEQIRLEKKEKRGEFKNRLLLVQVDE
ncbi:nucleoside triphosphate pyrophosphohydrolase [Paenibacillus polymyxa]|uniref:nucleoside triphosphate pyrophosphohydrolase n=1 Tax=Paenibacillus polymyxa TaxID=1406 RepID=UPI002025B470|nr:nucleoside triphosphate pyrophosphohydrolase [Paenibacillus polymyxa]URJ61184.3 nucleoside triphosphate pyrophosphohydrolase [Paenibacillus polymyxa]